MHAGTVAATQVLRCRSAPPRNARGKGQGRSVNPRPFGLSLSKPGHKFLDPFDKPRTSQAQGAIGGTPPRHCGQLATM
ncbi:hypothetical protein, partial [Pseudacidovorax intermedius]|uniref:hypothetical protein n=1 Tax=Pseudacidovorax intermedius TaxID=433924 RepID=UPI001E42400E